MSGSASGCSCVERGELRDLFTQAEVLAAEMDDLLDEIGVAQGAAVLDVGCGALGIVPLLAARVGERGRVVGVDLDQQALESGERSAADLGLRVETVHADAADTGLPSGCFDLVHERALLVNVNEPQAVVAEMARLARPGGVVALQEPDSSGWVCDPPHPAWELLREELLRTYPRAGRDFDLGRRTARLLRSGGLERIQVRVRARVTAPGDYFQTFLPGLVATKRAQILAGSLLTADRLDSYLTQLRTHLQRHGTLTCQPAMWQAWGIKP